MAPSWFTTWGLGAWDVNGLPPGVITPSVFTVVTWVVAVVGALAAVVAFSRWPTARRVTPGEALCCALLVITVLLAIPASVHFRDVVTLDRYLLPVTVPAGLLLVRALRDRRVAPHLPLAVLAGVALFSVVATYDHLSFQRAFGDLTDEALVAGVAVEDLDAGPGFAGYHATELASLPPAANPRPTWWTSSWTPATTGRWIISSAPQPGYRVVAVRSYPTILQTAPSALYLLTLDVTP